MNYELWAATIDGREHRMFGAPGAINIFDVAKDGRALVASVDRTTHVNGWFAGEPGERDMSWLEFSFARDLSPDGQRVLLSYSGEGSSPNYDVYVRNAASADATRIGEGEAQQFSPDGRSVLTIVHGPPSQVQILPIGTGQPTTVATGPVTTRHARWMPDGKHLLILGTEAGKGLRAYVTDLAGSAPRPVSPEGSPTR
jgi:Tol biopolymer transport system component